MKSERQACILEIVRYRHVETQDELIQELKKRGFRVTQATVSRDIKELRLVKTLEDTGVYHYTVASAASTPEPSSEMASITSRLDSIFQHSVHSVVPAGNLVVVKCAAGMAQAACVAMDALNWSNVVGTLAGEDTFVCITRSDANAVAVSEELKRIQQSK